MKQLLITLCTLFLGFSSPAIAQVAPGSAQDICPIKIGSDIPDATLKMQDGSQVNLKEWASGSPSILVFYRGGWCPYCNMQLIELEDIKEDLNALGYKLAAISPDAFDKIEGTVTKNKVGYDVFSDAENVFAQDLGIAFERKRRKKKKENFQVDVNVGQKKSLLPVPSIFFLDGDGKVVMHYINPDYKTRLPSSQLLKMAEILK